MGKKFTFLKCEDLGGNNSDILCLSGNSLWNLRVPHSQNFLGLAVDYVSLLLCQGIMRNILF